MNKKPKVFAIDFDGVVHDHVHPVAGFKMGPPMEGAKEVLTLLKKAGHTIIIHTVKGDNPGFVMDWMNHYKIPFDDVTRQKPVADYYIDDRAVKFTSWKELRTKL